MTNPTARRRYGSSSLTAKLNVGRRASANPAGTGGLSGDHADVVVETAIVVNNLDRLISGRVNDLAILKDIDESLKAGATKAEIHKALITLAHSSREAFLTLQSSRDALAALHRKSTGGVILPVVDHVTGLPNKESFEARLNDTFEKSAPAFDTVLMLIDIGALQILATEAGSKTANKVIRRFAMILKKVVKHQDFVARIGPQGFAIIFRHVLPENVAPIGMRIYDTMQEKLAPSRDPLMQLLSVTIGIAGNRVDDKSAADLMQRAQDSLAMARKQVGGGIYMA